MIKLLLLTTLICLLPLLNCDTGSISSEPIRSPAVPADAKWVSIQKQWMLSGSEGNGLKFQFHWNKEGKLVYRRLTLGIRRKEEFFYPNGKPSMQTQSIRAAESLHGNFHWKRYGMLLQYENSGRIARISCSRPVDYPAKSSEGKCGREVNIGANGRRKFIRHSRKCEQGCGEFQPFMPPGEYYVIVSSLRMRSDSSVKAKQLFALKQNEKITVVKDTRKIETYSFETAPWVKVRTRDGREGYAFGGFLRKVGTPWFDLTK